MTGKAIPSWTSTAGDGLIWINGGNCNLKGTRDADNNLVIGSPLAPVILVSAASNTILNGGVNIFGVLYIFDDDPAGSTAKLSSTGNATVYGAVIIDGVVDKLQGNFQIVYNEDILIAANGVAGVGSLNGGWRDFGLPDILWPEAP